MIQDKDNCTPSSRCPLTVLGSIIPFASGTAPLVGTNTCGASASAALINFSNATRSIPLGCDDTINLTSNNIQQAFSIPKNCILDAIYTTVGNWGSFCAPTCTQVTPYVMIFRAMAGQNVFYPIWETKTKSAEGFSCMVPANSMLTACSFPNVILNAGERLLIAGLCETEGTCKQAQTYYFYFTGGISLAPITK